MAYSATIEEQRIGSAKRSEGAVYELFAPVQLFIIVKDSTSNVSISG